MGRVFKLLFAFFFVLGLAREARADLAVISVSPVTESIALSKGETASGIFMVSNLSGETQHIYVEPRYWHMVEENKKIPLDSWLDIEPGEFDIGPNEDKKIAYRLTVPEEAVGELAVMIAFRPQPLEAEETTINVVFSVSLYVRVRELEKIECKISDFKLWKFEDRNGLGVSVELKNTGNVHLKPKMQVFIQNIFSRTLNRAVLSYGKPTYPGKSQDYGGAIYNFKLKPGIYKAMVDAEYTYIPQRFRRKIYFLVGKDGEILFTFFRRPKDA